MFKKADNDFGILTLPMILPFLEFANFRPVSFTLMITGRVYSFSVLRDTISLFVKFL